MSEKKDFSNLEWYDNRFKAVDVLTIQNTIAKALGELIDEPVQCWISNVDFEGQSGGIHNIKFNASVSKPLGTYKEEDEK